MCFVMLFVHFSVLIDHRQGNNVQRNECVTNAVNDVYM